jgi:RNA polymerase sigma-70 factor (ECF subfamily)
VRPEPEPPGDDSAATRALLDRVAAGDPDAVGDLLAGHRPALVAFVDLHLDRAVRTRVDASDVVQEAQAELARRMADYLNRRPMPFRLWARKTAYERLLKARRAHRAGRRDVAREVAAVDRSSAALARSLVAPGPTASEAAGAKEAVARVARAVEELPAADREILLMRHVEGLTHPEVGCLLGIDPAAARQRYGRALFRLQKVLGTTGVSGTFNG